eukprot:symbB.v1.2.025845.t1/scaffold2495.1/size77801/6
MTALQARVLAMAMGKMRQRLEEAAMPSKGFKVMNLRENTALRENVASLLSEAISLAELFDDGAPFGHVKEDFEAAD